MNNNTQLRESSINNSSCLVIGGGISGLIAAQVLQRHRIKVTVLDKGRGIGGRLATRRVNVPEYGQGIFDYGAQHFQVTDIKFQKLLDDWMQVGLVEKWTDGFCDAEGNFFTKPTCIQSSTNCWNFEISYLEMLCSLLRLPCHRNL